MATTVHRRTCPLCEAMCGLDITVTDGQVSSIRGSKDDVWSKGYICPKGTTLGRLHEDPDRLRAPMVRDGDTWREVSWEEAFEACEKLLHPVIERYGIEALTAFIGNPVAHNFSLQRYVGVLIGMSGIPRIYSSGTVDQWPKNVSSALMYGGMWQIPVPDITRTDLLVIMGANPQASQGSLLACSDILGEIDAVRKRGKVILIDPRRTGTAAHADEWLPIVPGTDAALLMAVVHVLFSDALVNLGGIADVVAGVDDLRAAAADFSPERVADTCQIPAERIRQLAHELANTERAVVYGRIGLCNQEFGTLASWLVDVVNILTRHFDVPGGLMFSKPVNWAVGMLPRSPEPEEVTFGKWRSRVRGAPEVLGQVPVSCLAEEIATPGDGQIKALITVAGNPAVSAPDAGKLQAALPALEAMISIDNWMNETTRHAHVILPGLSPLEQPHFDDLLWAFAVRSAGKWSEPVFATPTDRPAEWEIMTRLAGICAGQKAADVDIKALDDGFVSFLAATVGVDPASVLATSEAPGPERILDLSIRSGPWGDRYGERPGGLTLDTFKAAPDGLDFGPMVPRLREVLRTPSGRLELAPAYILGDLPRLAARLERADTSLLLTSRRHLRSKNSWMHNVPVLVGGSNVCTLMISPQDAERAGLLDGQLATVTSDAGSVDVPVQVTADMMPGVVSLPHGWGHGLEGSRLAVAAAHAGVNNNLLAPGTFVDELSGNAAVNGIPVTVVPAVPVQREQRAAPAAV